MDHTITLEIPDSVYEPLVKTAQQAGRTPEELALEWLAAASSRAVSDPVEKFIGAFKSDVPDWADQHDKYLGQALTDQMNRDV